MLYRCFFVFLFIVSCKKENKKTAVNVKTKQSYLINESGKIISDRILTPKGYKRLETELNSFANYLQGFPLKAHNSKVHLFNGKLKNRQDVHIAVLDIDVGKRDLQQCADATIRLRAEYLFKQKKYKNIQFEFTNGFKASYLKWQQGYRIKIKGNSVNWYKTNKSSTSYISFKEYLKWVFIYSGTLSLNRELPRRNINNIKIGDIFVEGGSPGHAVIVVDMAKNNDNEKIFLLAQSYMPAQEIHILKNFNNPKISPWYSLKNLSVLKTPEWNFDKDDLKYF